MLKYLLSSVAERHLLEAVHEELYASNLYKHISNQCQRLGLFGAAKFFKNESKEELKHYQLLADYINDRGGVAEIPEIMRANADVRGLEDALKASYEAECNLERKYAEWYSTLHPVDPVTAQFLLQFLEIQRRSVGEIGDLLSRLKLIEGDRAAILLMDKELGE